MAKYTVAYEIVESYDCSVDADSMEELAEIIDKGHYSGELDRTWRDGRTKVINIWREDA